MTRRPRETDLFEAMEPSARERDNRAIDVVLVFEGETPAAWLLRKGGKPDSTRWVPKRLATRAEPPHQDVFEMPHWVAAERGWL